MDITWKAVLYGFIASIVIGFVSGATLPGVIALPVVGWGVAGILAGIVAGHVAGGTPRYGAVHGGLATVIGAFVLLLVATATGVLFAGLIPAMGMFVMGVFLLILHAIPGAVGGVIGSWGKERRHERRVARAAP